MEKDEIKPTFEMIICPNCKTEVVEMDMTDTKIHKIGCKGCRRWLWIKPSTRHIEVKRVPIRQSLSGYTFYI